MLERKDKIIGVLGGLGPQATLDFCARVLKNTPANSDQEHFRCVVDNNPKAPNRNAAIAGQGPSPSPWFAESAKLLARCGVDFIVMPCNTAHAFAAAITAAAPAVPFVSLIEETCRHLERELGEVKTVGLLAADGCLQAQLYQPKLSQLGMQVLTLPAAEQARFMQTLYHIKSQGAETKPQPPRQGQDMQSYAKHLIDAGAQVILAACTEIPLVLNAADITVPLLESTEILAQQTVHYANGSRELPALNR